MSKKTYRRFEGKTAIVTGASRGIGRATALALAREGAKILINYRTRKTEAENLVKEIERLGGESLPFQADVSNEKAVREMVETTRKRLGCIDILINNAGILTGQGPLLEAEESEFESMWSVNVKGILSCTKAVTPQMIEKRYGKIVNLASIAGFGTALLPGNTLYSATKAAVIVLTKRFALELGQYGINVNAVAPGLIRTDMGLGQGDHASEDRLEYFREKTMLRRIGEPEDVANLILFLASDEASFITGQTVTIDGGRIDFLSSSG
ncbi:MAG: SDR family NAD(P)-dependent oxidoreductase [Candidatus Bathyarchaeia archaeon]